MKLYNLNISLIQQIYKIKHLKKLNDIKINFVEYDGNYNEDFDRNNIITLYNTSNRNTNIINLLLLREDNKVHSIWIKDI